MRTLQPCPTFWATTPTSWVHIQLQLMHLPLAPWRTTYMMGMMLAPCQPWFASTTTWCDMWTQLGLSTILISSKRLANISKASRILVLVRGCVGAVKAGHRPRREAGHTCLGRSCTIWPNEQHVRIVPFCVILQMDMFVCCFLADSDLGFPW